LTVARGGERKKGEMELKMTEEGFDLDIPAAVDTVRRRQILDGLTRGIKSNRASEMGHPCTRYLVYNRTRGEERLPHSLHLQYIFEQGKMIEDFTLANLRAAGLDVIEQQRPYYWPEYEIGGHIDGKILYRGVPVPFEIKSMVSWSWESVDGLMNLVQSPAWFVRKMPYQVWIYLALARREANKVPVEGAAPDRALILLVNKNNGRIKQIVIPWSPGPQGLDQWFGENILKRALEINQHVRSGTLPDRITWMEACEECAYSHICGNARVGEGTVIFDAELEALLDRRGELLKADKEYKQVDEQVKEELKRRGKDEVIVGKWHVMGTETERAAYMVNARRYWTFRIEPLDKKGGGENGDEGK
jgi:hypothetical protein